jgi:acetyltransferase-like isoleucine patch superfamily enzyme
MESARMDFKGKISERCVIFENVKIGAGVTICDNVIVYSNVEIGDGCFVGPGCILGEPTIDFYRGPGGYENLRLAIGENSILRSNTILYAGSDIGCNFHTGHNVIIREHCKIGMNCSVGSHGDIQGYVEIGDYCRFHSNVHISQHTTIKDYVMIFPNAVLTNDPHPPSDTCVKGSTLEEFCIVSAGAILMPGINIGRDSIVGANALATKDVEPEKVVMGNPGRVVCAVQEIQCKVKTHEGALYPWRERFSRGMPWEGEKLV